MPWGNTWAIIVQSVSINDEGLPTIQILFKGILWSQIYLDSVILFK